MDIQTLMQAVSQDAVDHGGDVLFELDSHKVTLKVTANLEDMEPGTYEVNNIPDMLQKVYNDMDDGSTESMVDSFWRVMNEDYIPD